MCTAARTVCGKCREMSASASTLASVGAHSVRSACTASMATPRSAASARAFASPTVALSTVVTAMSLFSEPNTVPPLTVARDEHRALRRKSGCLLAKERVGRGAVLEAGGGEWQVLEAH